MAAPRERTEPSLLTEQDEPSRLTFSQWVAEALLRWRIVLRAMLFVVGAAVLAVVLIPPVYRSRASFVANASTASKLPPLMSNNAAASGLFGQLGMSTGADPSESPNFYIQLLDSRELLTRLVQSRFADPRGASPGDSALLLDILRIRNRDPKRKLEIGVKIMDESIRGSYDTKTNLVWFEVDSRWPELSAAIANRSTELLTDFNKEQRLSRTRAKRLFLEERVALAKNALNASEARLREFNEQNRQWLSSPGLVSLEQQLQRDTERAAGLYLELQRQMEATLLDEFNNAPLITVVDSAVAPRKAQWPRYGSLLVSTLASGLLLGLMLAGGAAIMGNWSARNPEATGRLSRAWRRVLQDVRSVFRRKTPVRQT
ncbi:MAG TPA: hypothetical protein VJZ25_05450 [Gemmatimonadaceae bacterium]|nr:hypothetical protein [Gemmatimonadaceae bacterium]